MFAFLALLVLLILPANAGVVKVISPVGQTLSESEGGLLPEVDLGVVGPGQKLEIIVSTETGEISKGGQTLSTREAEWDLLEVVSDSLPRGWLGQNSLRFESPMKAFVVVAKDAADGEYSFLFRTKDDLEDVTPFSFKAKARVKRNVLELKIVGEPVKLESKHVGVYVIELQNQANANDVFDLTVSGLPKAFEEGTGERTVFVPFNSRVTVPIQVEAPELGEFELEFKAVSLSSPAISSSKTTTLFAGTSLVSDLRAAARGVLLFPTAASSIYALLSLAASLLLG